MCVANGRCNGGQCACGHANEPCCLDGRPTTLGGCASFELYCDNIGANASRLCKSCGNNNEPCCEGNTCTEPGARCLPNAGLSQPSCKL
jgi:hypothetical protein